MLWRNITTVYTLTLLVLIWPGSFAFWVAPMWGNKVDDESYGPRNYGGGGSRGGGGGGGSPIYTGGDNVISQAHDTYVGESPKYGALHKYPGWVSRKQAGIPISSPLGKRFRRRPKTLWSVLFNCSIKPNTCYRETGIGE